MRAADSSPDLHGKYEQVVDRESAYETPGEEIAAAPEKTEKPETAEKFDKSVFLEKAMDNPALRSAASAPGREIIRGLFDDRRR
ncbi:hypothetical protein [Saccharopolyspora shandongensis]|uniref:hypothetical protein n=1 Tax=Saccharopolyspora shandongensis TaxID=418495 RepID=UPI0033C1318C